MPLETLSIGPVWTMTQNTIYALPPKRCQLFTDGAAPTIQQSNDSAFTANVAVTLTDGKAEVCGGFIRETNLATMRIRLLGV